VQVQTRQDEAPRGRQGLIGRLLADALAESAADTGTTPVVLDCGGGSGSFAVPLALGGATVTVVDISVDALATLQRRAAEAGVGELVSAVQGDVEALADAVPPLPLAAFDLVLAHGILDAVQDVPAAFAAIAARVRPGGLLSVLVNNPVAAVLARALAGDVAAALAELHAVDAALGSPGPDAVQALCHAEGLQVHAVHGVGVFAELVTGAALDAPGARQALDELERAAAQRSPFRDIAGKVHVLARRAVEARP
jgi:SAM-dependent methyltransferase